MKKNFILIVLLFFLPTTTFAQDFDHSHSAFTKVLESKVTENGFVKYRFIRKFPNHLNDYITSLNSVSKRDFSSWSKQQQIAFLINLYNAETLQLIIENYPVKSIKDIGGWFGSPWKQKVVGLFGNKVTLDHIEHERLRVDYKEPGIHFALVCAAKSCPPLRSEAYRAEDLKEQFANQAEVFLATADKNRLDKRSKTLYLSKIFKWFEKDFTAVAPSVVEYLIPFFPENEAQFLRKNKVSVRYTTYDWSLNEAN